jgi:hypothetical protein
MAVCCHLSFSVLFVDISDVFAVPTVGVSYAKQSGCYLLSDFQGGSYDNLFTAQTCGALCLGDACCLSFNSGTGVNSYDCYLSYTSAASDKADFTCDSSKNFDYYQKICKFCFFDLIPPSSCVFR